MSKGHILVVDDTKDGRLFLNMMLEDDYTVTEADSGETCLKSIADKMPDLVLLDVEMPGMSGYETCMQLRKQHDTKYLPVIFVSALDSTQDRLEGFEAGGNDYLIKPVDEDGLLRKITDCLQRENEIKLAKIQMNVLGDTLQQVNDATSMAMEAMTVSGELGLIINFVKDVQMIDSLEAVAQAVMNTAQQFSLSSAAMVISDANHFVGCQEDSLEAELLRQVAGSNERIFSVGVRTVVKNKHIVLLIKDMPLDNDNLYGRVKDHLAVFMDIANGHLMTLEARNDVIRQRKVFFNQIIDVAEKQIKKTGKQLLKHDQQNQQIMQGMLSEMESMLFSLGLEEDQEEKLMSLADQAKLKLEDTAGLTHELSNELGVILEKLYEFQGQ